MCVIPVVLSSVVYRFTQNDFNYANLLTGPPMAIPDEALIQYGDFLLDLFRQKNSGQFVQEMPPKIHHLSTSHGVSVGDITSQLQSLIAEMMQIGLDEGPEKPPLDVKVRSWCNQRVYELYIEPGKELIRTVENDGGLMKMPVYVAAINGGLKIVR
jgi:hypothetical protein